MVHQTLSALRVAEEVGDALKSLLDEVRGGELDLGAAVAQSTAACAYGYKRMVNLGGSGDQFVLRAATRNGSRLWEEAVERIIGGEASVEEAIVEQLRHMLGVYSEVSGCDLGPLLEGDVEDQPSVVEETRIFFPGELHERAMLRVKSYVKDKLGRWKHVVTHDFIGDNKRHANVVCNHHIRGDKMLSVTGADGQGRLTGHDRTVKLLSKKEWVKGDGVEGIGDQGNFPAAGAG